MSDMTDAELLRWIQNQDANPEPPINLSNQKHHGIMFFTESMMRFTMQGVENPIVLSREDLIREIDLWVDGIEDRPHVLSVRDFNNWAQGDQGWFFVLDDLLSAYETVVRRRFPHSFEFARVINIADWVIFFETHGGEGMVAGTIDIPKDGVQSMRKAEKATYHFTNENEAMFARVCFC